MNENGENESGENEPKSSIDLAREMADGAYAMITAAGLHTSATEASVEVGRGQVAAVAAVAYALMDIAESLRVLTDVEIDADELAP